IPAPALRTRFGSGCHATPSRGAKSSFCGCHSGVPGGASVMVAKLFTCVTVNGRLPLPADGAALYSHRNPYVIVNLRVAFHVSWAKRLQFEKISWTSAALELINASGSVLANTAGSDRKRYCTAYGVSPTSGRRRR